MMPAHPPSAHASGRWRHWGHAAVGAKLRSQQTAAFWTAQGLEFLNILSPIPLFRFEGEVFLLNVLVSFGAIHFAIFSSRVTWTWWWTLPWYRTEMSCCSEIHALETKDGQSCVYTVLMKDHLKKKSFFYPWFIKISLWANTRSYWCETFSILFIVLSVSILKSCVLSFSQTS